VTYAGLIIYLNNSYCFELTDFTASRSAQGVLSNFLGSGLSLQRMILAENTYNSKVWTANDADDISLSFTNIIFMAMARPMCSSCYSNPTTCQNMRALIIPIVQIHGKSIPIDKTIPEDILSQCIDSAFDSKLIMTNVQFHNYKIDYTQDANQYYRNCSNNYVFQQPAVPDQSSRVYLKNTTAKNSNRNSFFQLQEPPQQFLFWRGGCGDFNCSGNKNWILTDQDGSLFGSISQVIPRNDSLPFSFCQNNVNWNARWCSGINFGMLEFQNDGPDQRLRLVAPVNISNPNMLFVLNEWREWQWLGPDPMDKRLARFNGIIMTNTTLELQFETVVPEELKMKLENYGVFWWTVVQIRYERPNVIEVWNMKNQTFINPFRTDQNVNLTDMALNPDNCGANIYDPDTSRIYFVLNNLPNCILKVRTIDGIRITMHLQTTVNDFYANNGVASFIDKISAFLGLDLSRIRVAQIKTGSVIVGFTIIQNQNLTQSTSADDSLTSNYTNTPNASQIVQFNQMVEQLQNYSSVLQQAVSAGTLNISNAKVLDMQSQLVVKNITNTTNNTNGTSNNTHNGTSAVKGEDSTMLILLATMIPGCLILFLILCCCLKNKDGVSMIKLIFVYSKKKEVDVTFNQELINQSKVVNLDIFLKLRFILIIKDSEKWRDDTEANPSKRNVDEDKPKDLGIANKYMNAKIINYIENFNK